MTSTEMTAAMADDAPRRLAANAIPKTGDEMRAVLVKAGVFRNRLCTPPSDAAMTELARLTRSWNRIDRVTLGVYKSREVNRKVLEALEIIKLYAPSIQLGMSNSWVVDSSGIERQLNLDIIGLLDNLIAVSERVETKLIQIESPNTVADHALSTKRRGSRWHAYLPRFESEFRKAMLTTNPNLKIGRTSDGPLARFLTVVLPLITDEKVTQMAVAKRLKQTGGLWSERKSP